MKVILPDNYKYSLNHNSLLIETLVYDNKIQPIINILLAALTCSMGRELDPPLLIEIVNDLDNENVEVQIDRNMNVIVKPSMKLKVRTRKNEVKSWSMAYMVYIIFSIIAITFFSLITLKITSRTGSWFLILLVPLWLLEIGIVIKYLKYKNFIESFQQKNYQGVQTIKWKMLRLEECLIYRLRRRKSYDWKKKISIRAKPSILLGLIYGVVNFVLKLDTFHKIMVLFCLVRIMDVLIDYLESEHSYK